MARATTALMLATARTSPASRVSSLRAFAPALANRVRSHRWDAIGLATALVYSLPSLWYPFAGDQPIHWYIGDALLDGMVPYESGISTKPPAVFVVHALSILLFGNGQHAVRWIDLLFVFGCAALVASFGWRSMRADGRWSEDAWRSDGDLGASALLTAGIHYTFFDYSDTGHPELWQGFFMLAAAWLVTRTPPSQLTFARAAGAGVLACTAVMFKHAAMVTGVLVGAATVWWGLRSGAVGRGALLGVGYTLGVAAVTLGTLGMFASAGAFDEFWEVMVEYILHYASAVPGEPQAVPPWIRLDYGGLSVGAAIMCLLCGLAVTHRVQDPKGRRLGLWIAALTASALATVIWQGRALRTHTFDYHFVVAVPFLALCIHWGLRVCFPRSGRSRLLLAALFVAASFLWAPRWSHSRDWSYRAEWARWACYVTGRCTRADRLEPYGIPGRLEHYPRQERVGRTIRRLARPTDTLCVEGFATPIYQVAKLRCPSRHFAEVSAYEGLPDWMAEHRRVLTHDPPTFVVTFSDRRQRITQLLRRGYARHDVRDGSEPHYVIMHRTSRR